MSWHFSRALEEAFSEAGYSDGAPSAQLSGTPTHGTFWSPGKTTDVLSRSRSGMTYRPSTDTHGEAVLTWCLADSLVRTSAPQEKAQASPEPGAACGRIWHASLAKYDPDSSSWKTHQCLLLGDLEPFSGTWPRWGMMRNGECWELLTPAHRISESASGLWPTPNVPNGGRSIKHVTDWRGKSAYHNGKKVQVGLESVIRMWATPQARDFRTGQQSRWENPERTRNLNDQIGGQLNPTWVEKMMGWPQEWTDVKPMIDFQMISWLMGFHECEDKRTTEVMRVLRNSNAAQSFQREAGRPISIQEAKVLLTIMCKHKIGSDQAWLLMEGAEASAGEVRSLRIQAGAASSSCRSGHKEQSTGEHSDFMQALPRFLAHDGKEAWASGGWEDAIPRTSVGITARVDRLRCIGNGQVPAVAALAWRKLNSLIP